MATAQENASNPLAAVNNTDFRYQYFDLDGSDLSELWVDGIQSLPNNYWAKLDAIVPVDWENDNAVPATFEVQLGKMFSSSFGTYTDLLLGVGGDKPYEWGVGVGVRFNY
jgi:hypothetical protein